MWAAAIWWLAICIDQSSTCNRVSQHDYVL